LAGGAAPDSHAVPSAVRARDLLPSDERLEHQFARRNRNRRVVVGGEARVVNDSEQIRHFLEAL
jgi:hypothetical protein